MNDTIIKVFFVVIGLLIAICLSLVTWGLVSIQYLREEFKVVNYKLNAVEQDTDVDLEQNRRLTEQKNTDRKFWRLHRWAASNINELRADSGKPLVRWPEDATD